MAEGGPNNTLCRYYLHGACNKGSRCIYSHDIKSKSAMVCRYYQQGSCAYGTNCRYDHVRPSPKQPTINGMKITGFQKQTESPNNLVKLEKSDCSVVSQCNMLKQDPSPQQTVDMIGQQLSSTLASKSWADAEEFVPGKMWKTSKPSSYAQIAKDGVEEIITVPSFQDVPSPNETVASDFGLCPYAANGECLLGINCTYIHGDFCDYCNKAVLHPADEQQRKSHITDCIKEHEKQMMLSFATQRSQEKVCGVCMEVVWQKEPATERRFGILSSCNHIFCLQCIRKWRANKQFENDTIRSCPECRVKSDFVTPSKYWFEDKDDKERLILEYKKVLSTKPCMYFDQGRGECNFNEHCFYLHAYPDGRIASPKPRTRRRRRNADGDDEVVDRMNLWDFIEERENLAMLLQDLFDVEEMMEFDDTFFRYLSDSSDDSFGSLPNGADDDDEDDVNDDL